MAAELKRRRWLGIEIGPTDDVVRRFADMEQDRKILAERDKQLTTGYPTQMRAACKHAGWRHCEPVHFADTEKR